MSSNESTVRRAGCGFRRKRLLKIAERSWPRAARLFCERGIGATGVDAITEDAGLTHGAVYSRIRIEEAIAVEAIRGALQGSEHLWQRLLERKGRRKAFPAIVTAYLSAEHRDFAGKGCVVAALGQ